MKSKIICLIIALIFAFALAACGERGVITDDNGTITDSNGTVDDDTVTDDTVTDYNETGYGRDDTDTEFNIGNTRTNEDTNNAIDADTQYSDTGYGADGVARGIIPNGGTVYRYRARYNDTENDDTVTDKTADITNETGMANDVAVTHDTASVNTANVTDDSPSDTGYQRRIDQPHYDTRIKSEQGRTI